MTDVDWDEFDRNLDAYLDDQLNAHLAEKGGDDGQPTDREHPRCVGCGRRPWDISEYVEIARAEEYRDSDNNPDPVRAVRDDGTFNRSNGHFWCTTCYVKAGQPLGVAP